MGDKLHSPGLTKARADRLYNPTTTKGDLISNDGTQVTRVGVGASGTVLMADPNSPSGIAWSTAYLDEAFARVWFFM
ncbi:MAG: hypothetical protein K2R98_19485 [Gemmataceae bacterium]|nr:hypothetical protein [Gemmataceae bacterium]